MIRFGLKLLLGGGAAIVLGIALFVTSLAGGLPGYERDGLWQGPLIVLLGVMVVMFGRKALRDK